MKKFSLTLAWLVFTSTILFSQSDCQQVQIIINTASNGSNIYWSLQSSNGEIINGANYNNNTTISIPLCLPADCYSLVTDYIGNTGWGNANIMVTSLGAVLVNTGFNPTGVNNLTFGINSPDCETSVISGCMDPAALNYNAQAVIDDGSCNYPEICPNGGVPGTFYLCTFSNGANVAIQIVSDGGAILFEQYGFANGTIMNIPVCIDPDACYTVTMSNTMGEGGWYNGYWWLNTDNGQVATNTLDPNLIVEVSNFSLSNTCDPIVVTGCTNPTASNYNPSATEDDGSCILPGECEGTWVNINVGGGSFLNEVNWTITGSTGFTLSGGAPFNNSYCLPDDCYTISMYDSFGDGWNNSFMNIAGSGGLLFSNTLFDGSAYNFPFGLNTEDCEVEEVPVYGCMDPTALNYNSFANIDDNSCIYPFECENGVAAHLYLCAFSNAAELSLEILGNDGSVLFSQQGFTNMQIMNLDVCLNPDVCYTAVMSNLNGNTTWYGGYWWLNQGNSQLVINQSLDEGFMEESVEFGLSGACGENTDIYGCTNPAALNYNPNATIEDGSCVYPTECSAAFEVIADVNGQNIYWIVTNYGNTFNTYSYVWSFGDADGTFSYEPYPTYTYTENGEYQLCLYLYQIDPNGWISCEDSVCFILSSEIFENAGGGGIQNEQGFTINVIDASDLETLGTGETTATPNLIAYPNPINGILNISGIRPIGAPTQIQLLDLNGRIIYNKTFNSIGAGQPVQIDMSNVSSGVYMLQLFNADSAITHKIVKE